MYPGGEKNLRKLEWNDTIFWFYIKEKENIGNVVDNTGPFF